MSYEAVFIDWDGTLSDSRFWQRWRDDPEHAEKYGKIQRALFESENGRNMTRAWMTGFKNRKDVVKYLHEWQQLPYDELEDELRYSAEHMELIDPGVLPKIQRLRDIGKQVVIATDNMDTFNEWTVPALGLHDHFDDVLNSYAIRKVKTELSRVSGRSEFFYRYLNDMGILPQDTVLIDNSLDAKRLESTGMNFLHVTEEHPLAYHLDTLLSDD